MFRFLRTKEAGKNAMGAEYNVHNLAKRLPGN